MPLFQCVPRSMEKKGDTTDAAHPTIWLCNLCRQYFIWIRNICLMYNNQFWIFLIQMMHHLQSMYNHMVGCQLCRINPLKFYFVRQLFKFLPDINLPSGHTRSHKICWPLRFSRFNVYWIQETIVRNSFIPFSYFKSSLWAKTDILLCLII